MDYETVLASVGFNSGRHYWEIKLDVFVEMEDIFVGVARRGVDLHTRAWDTGSFWGWICAGGRKFCPASPGPMVQEYGGFSKINDVVGVLFEFKDGVGSISFYNNGVSLMSYLLIDVIATLGNSFRQHPSRHVLPCCVLILRRMSSNAKPQSQDPWARGVEEVRNIV